MSELDGTWAAAAPEMVAVCEEWWVDPTEQDVFVVEEHEVSEKDPGTGREEVAVLDGFSQRLETADLKKKYKSTGPEENAVLECFPGIFYERLEETDCHALNRVGSSLSPEDGRLLREPSVGMREVAASAPRHAIEASPAGTDEAYSLADHEASDDDTDSFVSFEAGLAATDEQDESAVIPGKTEATNKFAAIAFEKLECEEQGNAEIRVCITKAAVPEALTVPASSGASSSSSHSGPATLSRLAPSSMVFFERPYVPALCLLSPQDVQISVIQFWTARYMDSYFSTVSMLKIQECDQGPAVTEVQFHLRMEKSGQCEKIRMGSRRILMSPMLVRSLWLEVCAPPILVNDDESQHLADVLGQKMNNLNVPAKKKLRFSPDTVVHSHKSRNPKKAMSEEAIWVQMLYWASNCLCSGQQYRATHVAMRARDVSFYSSTFALR